MSKVLKVLKSVEDGSAAGKSGTDAERGSCVCVEWACSLVLYVFHLSVPVCVMCVGLYRRTPRSHLGPFKGNSHRESTLTAELASWGFYSWLTDLCGPGTLLPAPVPHSGT